MPQRDRLLTLFRGEIPDRVPYFADLSHWFVAQRGGRFIPMASDARDTEMVELHREVGAGLYLNMGAFYDIWYDDEAIREEARVEGDRFIYQLVTPLGTIHEERRWSPISHSWDITHRLIQSPEDFPIVALAMRHRQAQPRYERYHQWAELCGEIGVPFDVGGYSGLGYLVSRYMGLEATVYALQDQPHAVAELIEVINEAQLRVVDVMVGSPSPALLWSDNLDAVTQPPPLFRRFSMDFYRETARRAHQRGKLLSVHIDGRLHGLLPLLAECGVDIADAVTPAPMGDLTPEQCREEAGPDMILWGGVPPDVWEERYTDEAFEQAVRRWLDLRRISPRLVLGPGDQVPPGAPRRRIERAAELAEEG